MMAESDGWACVDCSMLIANGETPPEMSEEATAEWLAEIERRTEGFNITWGGEHDESCPNLEETDLDGNRVWVGGSDCYCEVIEFTWSACDVCGSRLGGERNAVTFFKKEN